MKILARSIALTLAVLSPSLLSAQSDFARDEGKAAVDRDGGSPDGEWNVLKNLGNPRSFPAPAASDAASLTQARQQFVADLVRDADRLKDFGARNPTHANAREARRLEAQLLVQAWQAGDTVHDAERTQLVSEVRRDPAIDLADRAELATLADHVAVGRRRDLDHAGKVLAYEQVNRGLAAEFPTLPNAYESLVQVAKDSPPARAQAIARDVLAMPAPVAVKVEAQIILDRYALIGRSLPELVRAALGQNNAVDRAVGTRIVVYSWASFSTGSIALAKDLATQAPRGATLIGVCLDHRDLAPARAKAAAENLPGEQLYDWMGRQGELAGVLKLVDPGVVFVTDAGGVIRSITSPRDPASLSNL